MKILVSGLLAYDKIMNYPGRFGDQILPDKIHQINISFVTEELAEHFGGCSGNIAYTLALLGESPVILAAAGKDFGPYKEHLTKFGVDQRFIKIIPDKATSAVTIMTDKSDNQIAAVYLGTMAYSCELAEKDLPKEGFAIIAPGNVADMQRLPDLYRKNKVPFIFDPGQEIPLLSAEDLKNDIRGAKALISNDYELSLIMDKTKMSEQDILQSTEMLVTTLGEKGSRIRTKDATYEISPAKVGKVVDPTGAGDAYRAGFIKGLLSGWPLQTVGQFAGVVAAYAIENYGPQSHQFTLKEAKERYVQNFGDSLK